jgi:uncharacterized protein
VNREDIVLATFAVSSGAFHSPVQVQKLLFLIDRNLKGEIGGPYFHFVPYNYGPFDKAVYDVLEKLSDQNLVEIVTRNAWREYALTESGIRRGNAILKDLSLKATKYIEDSSKFVLSLGFTDLVSSIYKAYPEMKRNSVFQE